MRYMMLIYSKEQPGGPGRDMSERNYSGHMALMEEAARKGLFVAAEPLAPTSSATTVRVPVLVGHAESVWIEFEDELTPEQAEGLLAEAPSVRLVDAPTPAASARTDDVLVGRVRRDRAGENGLVLFLACDNLNKGAALNAVQIAERVLDTAWRPLTSA